MTYEQPTVVELIEYGAAQLSRAPLHFGHGTNNAWDEAVMLVLGSIGLAYESSMDISHQTLGLEQTEQIKHLIERRIQERLPAAYLIGKAWFAGLEFMVNEDVLVPRSPLAELIIDGFTPWLKPQDHIRVLDLCTGCGCIAISIASHIANSSVDATDISTQALKVARQNVLKHQLADRIRLLQGDLFAPIATASYDLIVTNPPYVGVEEMVGLPDEYRAEPSIALASGEQGLDLPLRILLDAATHLSEQGILVLEVGNSDVALQACLPEVPFLWLEFEHGGHGVCLLEKQQLLDAQDSVAAALRKST